MTKNRRILRMAETEAKVGLKETQIRQKVSGGHVPETGQVVSLRPSDRIHRRRD